MTEMSPKAGDVLTVANARWAVVSSDGRELRLLRLNEPAPEPDPVRDPPRASNVLDVNQAAVELGIAPKTVREYCKTGQIKGRKVGRTWRILRSDNPALAAG